MKKLPPLVLGPDVVTRLLPHRRPFLMVDSIEAYSRAPRPTLCAARMISANEPVFEGHFPGLHLWPGVYTIEGMGQSCNLLRILLELQAAWEREGRDPEEVLAGLRNMDLGFHFQPGYREDVGKRLAEVLRAELADPISRMGVSAAVDVKFLQPVFAGQRLVYTVTQTHAVDRLLRFEVEAAVEARVVARGVMSGAMGASLPGALHDRDRA
jgi:3-hydroxyacyl-[acyl-carrier-protein] dehydratase